MKIPANYTGRKAEAYKIGYTQKVKRLSGMSVGLNSESEACAAGYYAATQAEPPKPEPLWPDSESAEISDEEAKARYLVNSIITLR